MVNRISKTMWRGASFGALAALAALAAACGGDEGGNNQCVADPDCVGCVAEGACCEFSINCAGGSICNLPTEDLYDSSKPEKVCVRVICQRDSDCSDGKTCSLEKVCKPPVCQTDGDCGGGLTCQSGTCGAPPSTADVASCEVVTRDTAVRQGTTVPLTALARNRNGAILPGIAFEWTSSAPSKVSVSGAVATGGAEDGSATLTAKVGASISCARQVNINNYATLAQGKGRVVVVTDGDGLPVADAQVMIEAGSSIDTDTDATGAATFDLAGAIQSVTVMKNGFQLVSVLEPGTNDIFVPLPRLVDPTIAGGFRGALDVSATKKADIKLGIAGPAIPQNLLDFELTSLLGDTVPTTINEPQLSLDDTFDLPGGLVAGLGNKTFTADGDGLRCQGRTPGPGQLGCYLVRTPAGPSAGWALGGQLKLSEVTSIANELTNIIGGDGPIPIGEILTKVLPLFRGLNHALTASVFTNEVPKVNKEGQTGDCSNPNLENYDAKCQANFAQYDEVDMALSQKLNVFSTVTIPRLPNLPGEANRCVGGAVLLSGASLPGRGLVPLGLAAAVDTVNALEMADCRVAGVKKPFGPESADLEDGQLALSTAPPHSGIEGSQLFTLAVAIDPESIASDVAGFQASALVHRVDRFSERITVPGQFLAFPRGSVNKAAASVALTEAVAGATLTRVSLQADGKRWLVYAPSSASRLSLPGVAAGREILANVDTAYVLAMGMDGQFSNVWQFGSGKTLDRLLDTVTAFVVQQCAEDETAPCRIQ
jgi:hypothetical protein